MENLQLAELNNASSGMDIKSTERRLPTIDNLLNRPDRRQCGNPDKMSLWNTASLDNSSFAAECAGLESSTCSSVSTTSSDLPELKSQSIICSEALDDKSSAYARGNFTSPTDLNPSLYVVRCPHPEDISFTANGRPHGLQTLPSSNQHQLYHNPNPEGSQEDLFSCFIHAFKQLDGKQKPGTLQGDDIRMRLRALPSGDVLNFDRTVPSPFQETLTKEQQAKQRAVHHKEKESARRDVQKSLSLCLKYVTPAHVLPCTSYRHSKNNVEEPANLVTYDRCLLHLVNLEAVCNAFVRRGIVSQEVLDQLYAEAIPESVETVRGQLRCAEEYIANLRGGKKGKTKGWDHSSSSK